MPTPPGDPDYFDKVNYVIQAWSQPCEAPWYIYVETMGPAALEAFITLATFGWDDVARGYFRPRGLNPRRSGKRKGRWRRALPRFPEIGEEIGKRLPGADEVKGEKWSTAGKALWRIDTVMQRALFWWLVADVTIDFAFNWTSVLYETEWCKASNLGRFSYSKPLYGPRPGGFWFSESFPDKDYEQAPPHWSFVSGFAGSRGCTAGAAVSFQPIPGFDPPTSTAVRLLSIRTGKVLSQTGPEFTDLNNESSMPISGDMAPGEEWRVQSWHDGELADVGAGVTFATQAP